MDFKIIVKMAFLMRICKGIVETILDAFGRVLNDMLSKFANWYRDVYYTLHVTPQVWSLENMLNDEFDKLYRRIYITEPQPLRGHFFFRVTDPQDKKFFFGKSSCLVKDTRYELIADGFIVVLPNDINATDKMRGLIDKYKLVSIKYIIKNE